MNTVLWLVQTPQTRGVLPWVLGYLGSQLKKMSWKKPTCFRLCQLRIRDKKRCVITSLRTLNVSEPQGASRCQCSPEREYCICSVLTHHRHLHNHKVGKKQMWVHISQHLNKSDFSPGAYWSNRINLIMNKPKWWEGKWH